MSLPVTAFPKALRAFKGAVEPRLDQLERLAETRVVFKDPVHPKFPGAYGFYDRLGKVVVVNARLREYPELAEFVVYHEILHTVWWGHPPEFEAAFHAWPEFDWFRWTLRGVFSRARSP